MIAHPQLVSLFDVLKANTLDYYEVGKIIIAVRTHRQARENPAAIVTDEKEQRYLLNSLGKVVRRCERLGARITARVARKTRKAFKEHPPTYGWARDQFGDLQKIFEEELGDRWSLFLAPGCEKYYDHGPEPFGPDVAANFQSAEYDIREACKCLALERYTACVLHLMRVLERGLRAQAKALGVVVPKDEWNFFLEHIEKAIRALEALPTAQRAPDWKETVQFHSEAAINFRLMRFAWRNAVTHGDKSYDIETAPPIFDSVRSFMRQIAERLAE